jgi:hypothetical protein
MAPSKEYVVLGSQALVICRPTSIRSHAYHPLAQPPNVADMLHSYSNTVLDWARQPIDRVVQGTAHLAPPAMAAAAAAAGDAASLSHEWLPAMEDWSKAGLSQVEALRRQVEATNISDGSSSAKVPQLQNNIVSGPRLAAASSMVAGSHAVEKSTVAVAAGPAAAAAVSRPVGTASTAVVSSSIASLPKLQWLNSPSGPRCDWPSALGDAASNSSNWRSTPPGLRTTDWPVLSGVRAPHKATAALWPYFSMPGVSSRPPAAAGGGLGLGSSSSNSSKTGLLAMPVAPAADLLAEAFATAQATLMVPSEYLQVCACS